MHVNRLCAADKDQSLLPDNDPQMMDAENRGIYPSFQFPQQPVVMMPGHQVGDKDEKVMKITLEPFLKQTATFYDMIFLSMTKR